MPFRPDQPFNELPPLPPPGEIETRAVLKQAIAARTALAELKGTARLLPNQAVLIQTIGLQEAKLSSEIENIVTTDDALYRGFANQGEGRTLTPRRCSVTRRRCGKGTAPCRRANPSHSACSTSCIASSSRRTMGSGGCPERA